MDENTPAGNVDNNAAAEPQQPVAEPQVSELEALLKGITDPTGRQKYNDPVTAINALGHSQEHIQTLEATNKELQDKLEALQADLQTRQSVEDALSTALNSNQPQEQNSASLNPEDVQKMVFGYLQQHQQQATAQTNRAQFENSLREAYGDSYSAKVEAKAAALGIPVQNVVSLAEQSPAAAIAMLGVVSNPTPQQPPVQQAQVNTATASQRDQFQPAVRPAGSGVLGMGSTTAKVTNAMADIRKEVEATLNR